jgi:hypothetical protein
MFVEPKTPLLDTILVFIGGQCDSWPFAYPHDPLFTNIFLYSLGNDEGTQVSVTFQICLLALVGRSGFQLK